mmetsp:Transcript_4289/g.9408  ORF Transcript_4289/g.9408 Transcript_4289/m.9408 type:complete len:463 (-) Transcript_4289:109-1497(-)
MGYVVGRKKKPKDVKSPIEPTTVIQVEETKQDEEETKKDDEMAQGEQDSFCLQEEVQVFSDPMFKELERLRKESDQQSRSRQTHLTRYQQVDWAKKRGKNLGTHLSLDQIASLEHWFRSIDADGSGDISLLEIADPLLTTGLANSIEECVEIFSSIDEDGSNEIDFGEFLKLVTIKRSGDLARFRRKVAKYFGTEAQEISDKEKDRGLISILAKLKRNIHNSITLTTAVGIERRRFLFNSIMPQKKYKVHVPPHKFAEVKELMFATEDERQSTLDAFHEKMLSMDTATVPPHVVPKEPPREPPKPIFSSKPREKRKPQTQKTTPTTPEAVKSNKSIVLPSIKKFPPRTKQYISSTLRAGVTCSGPTHEDRDKYIQLLQDLEDSNVVASAQHTIKGANPSFSNRNTKRALARKDVDPFLQSYLQTSLDEQSPPTGLQLAIEEAEAKLLRQENRAKRVEKFISP